MRRIKSITTNPSATYFRVAGNIPPELGDLQHLTVLRLCYNNFIGVSNDRVEEGRANSVQ